MINAPEDKAGMAGALEGISYELGGTMGVAVMGSIIASIYTRTFTPPAEASLSPRAWNSLDQTLIAVSQLSADMAEKVSLAGKATFVNGVSVTLIGTTIITLMVFVSKAVYARNKRP